MTAFFPCRSSRRRSAIVHRCCGTHVRFRTDDGHVDGGKRGHVRSAVRCLFRQSSLSPVERILSHANAFTERAHQQPEYPLLFDPLRPRPDRIRATHSSSSNGKAISLHPHARYTSPCAHGRNPRSESGTSVPPSGHAERVRPSPRGALAPG